MISHTELGPESFETSRKLKNLAGTGAIRFAGNKNLKIYGLLSCKSGKRMKRSNRVFFKDRADAVAHGYRPCGHCMRAEYAEWKKRSG
jgi:methylphosphotriester-DNA--protein-cysteine methyltransferase